MEKHLIPVEFCQHREGIFIGLQHDPFHGACFALYTCKNCMTTYSKPLTHREAVIALNPPQLELHCEPQVA